MKNDELRSKLFDLNYKLEVAERHIEYIKNVIEAMLKHLKLDVRTTTDTFDKTEFYVSER